MSDKYIEERVVYHARNNNLEPNVVIKLIDDLSGFNPFKISLDDCDFSLDDPNVKLSLCRYGLMQVYGYIIDSYRLGEKLEYYDLLPIENNLKFGCLELRRLKFVTQDMDEAIKAYKGLDGPPIPVLFMPMEGNQ